MELKREAGRGAPVAESREAVAAAPPRTTCRRISAQARASSAAS